MLFFPLPRINPGQYVLPWPTIASVSGGTCGESELLLHGEFCNVSGTRPLHCGLDLEMEKVDHSRVIFIVSERCQSLTKGTQLVSHI